MLFVLLSSCILVFGSYHVSFSHYYSWDVPSIPWLWNFSLYTISQTCVKHSFLYLLHGMHMNRHIHDNMLYFCSKQHYSLSSRALWTIFH